jgi:hypothetical protein
MGMSEEEYQAIKQKVEREFPIRLKLAELAGRPKINVKNYKALETFDDTIADLFLEIHLKRPWNWLDAMTLVESVRSK